MTSLVKTKHNLYFDRHGQNVLKNNEVINLTKTEANSNTDKSCICREQVFRLRLLATGDFGQTDDSNETKYLE